MALDLKHHVFVCTSCRQNGVQKGKCFAAGANDVVMKFQEVIDDEDIREDVMVTNCGCFGLCDNAGVVAVYPDGVFYKNVTVDDVEEIVTSHLEEGNVVERLVLK